MLYIHIGTLKTGSTAIQTFLAAHADALAAQGIVYPQAGRRKRHKHFYLKQEVRRTKGEGGEEWAALNAECARHEGRKILVSDEGFALLDAADAAHVRMLLGDQPATVVVYFRDYASWLPSLYAEYTKNGRNLLDFDAYFEQVMAQPSQAEVIERWGNAFGWENVLVRIFSSAALVNGDAVDDLLSVVGTSRKALGAGPDEPVRAAPGWQALETARAVLAQVAQLPGGTVEGRIPLFVRGACMEAVTSVPSDGAKGEYLSAQQRGRCNEQTERDLAFLNTKLPRPGLASIALKPAADRPFLPTVAKVPAQMVAAAMSQLAVLLAAQVPDGKIERKRRLERREGEGSDEEDGREERRARRQQAKREKKATKPDKDMAAKAARAARAEKSTKPAAKRAKPEKAQKAQKAEKAALEPSEADMLEGDEAE